MTSTEQKELTKSTLRNVALLIMAEELSPEKYNEFMNQTGLAQLDGEGVARLREIKNMIANLVQKVTMNDTPENLNNIYLQVDSIRPKF